MPKLLHYKVFRQKLRTTSVGILLIGALIAVASYSFLRAGWISSTQSRSIQIFQAIEERLQTEDEQLTLQIVGAYASPPLIDDILQLFGSRSFDDYLEARLIRSQTTSAPIRSFPEYIRAYSRSHKSTLRKMVVHAEGFTHVLHFGSGEIFYEFDAATYEPAGIRDDFTIRKTLYNPSAHYQKIGDVSFLFRTEAIVGDLDFSDFTWAVLQDEAGNLYNLRDGEPVEEALLERSALVQESGQYAYRLLTYADDLALIRSNTADLYVLAGVMLVLSVTWIVFFVYNIRYDAVFIQGIFTTIQAMKEGRFDAVEGPAKAGYQRNEYGRIARELEDMSQKLKRTIESEYQLKIQQQQTEIRMLQEQINPHFMYNTLEALSAQALLNGDRPTSNAIDALGSLFREMTNLPPIIPMKDEARILETYLRIMEFKCAGNFFYHIDLPQELLDFQTVKFWMQPLAENFFTHGFQASDPYNLLMVRGYMEESTVCIDILNNGLAIAQNRLIEINESLRQPEREGARVGLRNVYNRLNLFYGGGVSLVVANNEEGGVIIRVRIQGGEPHV